MSQAKYHINDKILHLKCDMRERPQPAISRLTTVSTCLKEHSTSHQQAWKWQNNPVGAFD